MNAAFTGNVDMVKMLLEAGAEVNAKADNGWTALILAKRNGHAEIVRLLIEAGAMDDSHIEFGTDFNG
jgi:ankyrin repeat protein